MNDYAILGGDTGRYYDLCAVVGLHSHGARNEPLGIDVLPHDILSAWPPNHGVARE